MRGMSGAEKLAFPPAVRQHVSEANGFDLEMLTGCPKSIFEILGQVLFYDKSWLAGDITIDEFKLKLDQARRTLEGWNALQQTYPNSSSEWLLIADAYRHAALLRVLRFPDPFEVPCTDEAIRRSVNRILDISAQVSWKSTYYRLLLYPMFIAGTDAEFSHQHHYVQVCLEKITRSTGFLQPAILQLLEAVWNQRAESDGIQNVPWVEFVSQDTQISHSCL